MKEPYNLPVTDNYAEMEANGYEMSYETLTNIENMTLRVSGWRPKGADKFEPASLYKDDFVLVERFVSGIEVCNSVYKHGMPENKKKGTWVCGQEALDIKAVDESIKSGLIEVEDV